MNHEYIRAVLSQIEDTAVVLALVTLTLFACIKMGCVEFQTMLAAIIKAREESKRRRVEYAAWRSKMTVTVQHAGYKAHTTRVETHGHEVTHHGAKGDANVQ